jgi:hypothetical protein
MRQAVLPAPTPPLGPRASTRALWRAPPTDVRSDAASVLVELANNLAADMAIEQDIFYPAVKAIDEDLIRELLSCGLRHGGIFSLFSGERTESSSISIRSVAANGSASSAPAIPRRALPTRSERRTRDDGKRSDFP